MIEKRRNMIESFSFAPIPHTYFGDGMIEKLPELLASCPGNALLLTGRSSLKQSDAWRKVADGLAAAKPGLLMGTVPGEPTPALVDGIVEKARAADVQCVAAIGGGSVLDAGKAVSAMLRHEGSVRDYLEGVGTKKPEGRKVPFIAVPTTAGTGSEATKNAVLSEVGPGGFKKSLRHDMFVPDRVILDPALTLSCPPDLTAACGMDAFTQLLEAWVSTKASPMTDALAMSGLKKIRASLRRCVDDGHDLAARADVLYASYQSGIVLANAGLGVVHGFASPLGGFFDAPHGVVCGTLLGAATRTIIDKLLQQAPDGPALAKYAAAGALFADQQDQSQKYCCDALVGAIDDMTDAFDLPRLSRYGIGSDDVDRIVAATGLKNTPAALDGEHLAGILRARL